MYAVIATGGKQEKVSEGQVLQVERLTDAAEGGTVSLRPVLVVDGDKVTSAAAELARASVEAKVTERFGNYAQDGHFDSSIASTREEYQ